MGPAEAVSTTSRFAWCLTKTMDVGSALMIPLDSSRGPSQSISTHLRETGTVDPPPGRGSHGRMVIPAGQGVASRIALREAREGPGLVHDCHTRPRHGPTGSGGAPLPEKSSAWPRLHPAPGGTALQAGPARAPRRTLRDRRTLTTVLESKPPKRAAHKETLGEPCRRDGTGDRGLRRPQPSRTDVPVGLGYLRERGAASAAPRSTEHSVALARVRASRHSGRVGRWTAVSVSSQFMDAAFVFLTQSDGPSPIGPETNVVRGALSTGLLVLAVLVAALVVAYLVSALRRGG